MKAAALTVPVRLTVGDIEVDLGPLEVPMSLEVGKTVRHVSGRSALSVTACVELSSVRPGLAALLRETADRLEVEQVP